MKRDMDLVRKILLAAEASEGSCGRLEFDGYSSAQVGYHVFLAHQAGLVLANDSTFMESSYPNFVPTYLTWEGHEFLDSIKDESDWAKVKHGFIAPAGGFVMGVFKEWAKSEILKRLGGA